MSNPSINVTPLILGSVTSSSVFGALSHAVNWPTLQPTNQFSPGTGSGQIDTWWNSTRTLASNTNESLDLNASLTDDFGASVALLHVKLIAIYSYTANTTLLTVGAGSNPFVGPLGGTTPTHSVSPGGFWMTSNPVTGWAVVASTGDILKVANAAGASAQYDILIGGTTT